MDMPQTLNISAWASWATAQSRQEVMDGVALSALKTALETQAAVQEALIPPVEDLSALLTGTGGGVDLLV